MRWVVFIIDSFKMKEIDHVRTSNPAPLPAEAHRGARKLKNGTRTARKSEMPQECRRPDRSPACAARVRNEAYISGVDPAVKHF